MNQKELLLQKIDLGTYVITVGQWNDGTFTARGAGMASMSGRGSLTPRTFNITEIDSLVDRGAGVNAPSWQERIILKDAIASGNGIQITRLDTGFSTILPSIDGIKSSRFQKNGVTSPLFTKADVGKTFSLKLERI